MGIDRVEAEKLGFWEEAEEPIDFPCQDECCGGSIGPHGICDKCLTPGDLNLVEPCDQDGPITAGDPEADFIATVGLPVDDVFVLDEDLPFMGTDPQPISQPAALNYYPRPLVGPQVGLQVQYVPYAPPQGPVSIQPPPWEQIEPPAPPTVPYQFWGAPPVQQAQSFAIIPAPPPPPPLAVPDIVPRVRVPLVLPCGSREFFSHDGPLARVIPGYIPRSGQVELAMAMYENAQRGGVLLTEGPTGTGKSAAAIMVAAYDGRRSLISTATLPLQDQYLKKDLPVINKALGDKLAFALLKGRSNYLCLRKVNRGGNLPQDLVDWSNRTTTGDKGELRGLAEGWGQVSSTHEECHGGACNYVEKCWTNRARKIAAQADIIVCNHMILALSLLYPILPQDEDNPIDNLIVDEAHKLENYLRKALGWELHPGSYGAWDYRVGAAGYQISEMGLACEIAEQMFTEFDWALGDRRAIRVPPRDVKDLVRATQEVVDRIRYPDGPDGPPASSLLPLAEKAALWGQNAIRNLRQVFEFRPTDIVSWIERDAKGRVVLNSGPIPVDKQGGTLLKGFSSASLMSATLDIPSTSRDLGVADVARSLTVYSPFDWPGRVTICVPASMPLPPSGNNYNERRVAYDDQTAIHLRWVIERSGGGVLGLFSSNTALRVSREFLRKYPVQGVNVYIQGEGFERGELIRLFKEDRNSVLLGVQSLWEGVDAPGDTCRAVVIDKLPFSTPEDVVEVAIQNYLEAKTGQSGFFARNLPKALVALRQGMGRLMRTVTDRGVIVLLDRRGARSGGKRYWQTVRAAFPPAPVVESLSQIEQKLLEGR